MTPEEIHELSVKIYEALNHRGAELGNASIGIIETAVERFLFVPSCEVSGCFQDAYVEGWHRVGTMIRKMRVCKEHMDWLIGKEITE